ncbi:MAG TPA: asparagine synthase-related protein [Gemmatimonadota bacterium]|nr:asparagine synthase-related protein [Gemmatimonadota bacterium]
MIPELEPLEVHSGMISGPRRTPAPETGAPLLEKLNVRHLLEDLMLPALSRPPCKVAFSGGRDSSAILAMATHVARRHGLHDPIPLTFRYEEHPRTWETEWQELMMRHLDLRDWEIVPFRAEFDVLGPMARDTLRRHGLFWPPNTHTMIPMLQAARTGSLLTGSGGDEVFRSLAKPKKMTPIQIVRSLPPHRALMVGIVRALPLRWKILVQYHHGLRFPWLRPAARREVQRRFVENSVQLQTNNHPLERLEYSRYLELSRGIVAVLTHDADVELVEPFLDPRFFRAILSELPEEGFPSRNAALESFFGDLLPAAVVRRTSKAIFTESFWGPDSRDFANGWDGTGLDPSLVDPDALRTHWLRPRPDMRSATPLQAAWLASQASDSRA